MRETNKNGLGPAALLLFSIFPASLGAQTIGASSQGTLNLPLSPLSDCPTRTINYITQFATQQCFETAWSHPSDSQIKSSVLTISEFSTTSLTIADTIRSPTPSSQATYDATRLSTAKTRDVDTVTTDDSKIATSSSPTIASSRKPEPTPEVDQESEGDSPLDNANFLSFEEWKKQNLAKAGQSVETIGDRAAVEVDEQRRRPGGINNALDSLGEDTEIEIDFGGFVDPGKPVYNIPVTKAGVEDNNPTAEHGADETRRKGTASATHTKGKDAGKTCKERFNYASFDCAATVLKTNKESKGSTAVLVENKDSYLLNKCSAENKFFIVELCDDILVDTIVLANFEFFSSMFRTFRVSVSDRYPVKPDKWKELGTFEARNSREVQAFLVESPLIWARYLRVEFLAHFGNEYYCPVSLLRVHGTTMMEEFNHEMKGMREEEAENENGEEEQRLNLESEAGVITADVLKGVLPTPTGEVEETAAAVALSPSSTVLSQNNLAPNATLNASLSVAGFTFFDFLLSSRLEAMMSASDDRYLLCALDDVKPNVSHSSSSPVISSYSYTGSKETRQAAELMQTDIASHGDQKSGQPSARSIESSVTHPSSTSSSNHDNNSSSQNVSKTMNQPSQPTVKVSASSTQPPAANPTQESFFKSVHKRLQLLESNSTLSLQYIEEQSRILRDAFSKVEKRQLAKTTAFLESLNTTVLNEVHAFRSQYDHIWQSTVLELSSQREQSHHEVIALTARLSILADEIVFQKRMAILQFVLILLCLGLVIFSRAAPSSSSALLLQNIVDKSSANLARYTHFETPRSSPSSTRPPSRYGIFGRGSSSARSASEESDPMPTGVGGTNGDGEENPAWDVPKHPSIEYSPPTPTSSHHEDNEKQHSSETGERSSETSPDFSMRRQDKRALRTPPAAKLEGARLEGNQLVEGPLLRAV